MQDATVAGASLRDTIFTEAFDATWSVAISSNGQYWAAGSKRGEVRVWREAGQTLHLVWQAHTDTTASLTFSPDERLLASGSWDGSLKLWDLERGTLLWERLTSNINCVAFAPDGSLLASGGEDTPFPALHRNFGKAPRNAFWLGRRGDALAAGPRGDLAPRPCVRRRPSRRRQ